VRNVRTFNIPHLNPDDRGRNVRTFNIPNISPNVRGSIFLEMSAIQSTATWYHCLKGGAVSTVYHYKNLKSLIQKCVFYAELLLQHSTSYFLKMFMHHF
jgi:hypothetical protein